MLLVPAFAAATKYFDDVMLSTVRSNSVAISTAGTVRLGNADSIGWRNFANGGNLLLNLDASNNLLFNSSKILLSGAVTNADIDPSAAIAYSKLNLGSSITNADISASAGIGVTKLAALTASRPVVTDASGFISTPSNTLSPSLGGTGLNNSAASGVLKFAIGTPSVGQISNADIAAGAGIAVNKLASMNASQVVVTDASGFLTTSAAGLGGGSSGINILSGYNRDAESGATTNWSETGGGTLAVTSTAANVANGTYSFSFDASASTDYAISDARAIPAGLYGAPCLAEFYYKGFDSSITAQVYDGTNVLASQALAPASNYTRVQINFGCPSSGNLQLKFLASGDSAIGYWDEVHLGSALNLTSVSQASLYGTLTMTNCTAWTTTSGSFADPGVATGCTYVATGGASAPSTMLPAVTFTNLPPGNYMVIASGGTLRTTGSGTSNGAYLRITDGTTTSGRTLEITSADVGQKNYPATPIGNFTYTTAQSSVTFKIQLHTITGGTAGYESAEALEFFIYRFPLTSEIAVRPGTQNWRVDANISGANVSMGTSAVSTYTGLESGSLTLTNNTGALAAKIPCSSTNSPSGTTCSSGNESVGVSFDLPKAGDVKACVSFSWDGSTSASGSNVIAGFQIVETPSSAQTISQEGKGRVYASVQQGSTGSMGQSFPFHLCGTFSFASTGTKTLRLFYEQSVAGTVNSSTVVADASTSVGQRDIHWEVYPIDQQTPMPVLVGSVTSNSSGTERVERAAVTSTCSSSPCTIASQSGAWLSSISRTTTGQYVANFAAGIWSSAPTCVFTPSSGSNHLISSGTPTTSSVAFNYYTANAATALDGVFQMICMGPR